MLLTEQDLAEYLGLSVRTIQDWRRRGVGPRYVKFRRNVRYRLEDVEDYLDKNRHQQTEAQNAVAV